MRVDITGALSEAASPGVSRESLERLDERVATVHDRIRNGRADDEFGYAALNLPEQTDPDLINKRVDPVADAEAVLTVGIGGSALGAVTITDALDPGIDHYVLDNVDPSHTDAILDRIDFEETTVHVVSRSGTTAETLANFLVVREAMAEAGVDWTERTVVTTGESGPLRRLADRHDLPSFDAPAGVPGRFSVLSSVGLVPAAIGGVDITGILEGANEVDENLTGSLFECPPYAYGAVTTALDRRGATINAMMPYAESLEYFAEWFAQLWAESLGKDGLGQTPARALGATDQHSQLQLYWAGPRDTLVTFIAPRERPSRPIPAADIEELAYLDGVSLGELLDAELDATAASLRESDRPSVRIEIDRIDPRGIGKLLYGMEASCILAGELMAVDTFDQPAVDWGKEATRDLLRGDDTEATRSIAAAEPDWIE